MKIRCPHCRDPVEVLDDVTLSDISCTTCGSRISIFADETVNYRPEQPQTIENFRLIEVVGRGHFGCVWKAKDEELDRIVAIKLPRAGHLDEDEIQQFFREARAAAQLSHPNIVGVHEVGREDGNVYIVSDFILGATLKEWCNAKPISSHDAAELIAEVADALFHAHQQGVIHRDLKPSDIMIDGDGKPHVTDFGLAERDAGEITMTVQGQILGTPGLHEPGAGSW